MRKKKLKKKLIYCAQDIRSWEGYRILQVKSNRLDRNVRITLDIFCNVLAKQHEFSWKEVKQNHA